jgi:hypothetical protein
MLNIRNDMRDRQTQRALAKYVDAAAELAEAVKRNMITGGEVNKETILKLNEFTIAENSVKHLFDAAKKTLNKYDN